MIISGTDMANLLATELSQPKGGKGILAGANVGKTFGGGVGETPPLPLPFPLPFPGLELPDGLLVNSTSMLPYLLLILIDLDIVMLFLTTFSDEEDRFPPIPPLDEAYDRFPPDDDLFPLDEDDDLCVR